MANKFFSYFIVAIIYFLDHGNFIFVNMVILFFEPWQIYFIDHGNFIFMNMATLFFGPWQIYFWIMANLTKNIFLITKCHGIV